MTSISKAGLSYTWGAGGSSKNQGYEGFALPEVGFQGDLMGVLILIVPCLFQQGLFDRENLEALESPSGLFSYHAWGRSLASLDSADPRPVCIGAMALSVDLSRFSRPTGFIRRSKGVCGRFPLLESPGLE